MEMLTAIIIIASMWVMLAICTILVVWWLNKNNITVQITENFEGVYLSKGGRYRLVKGKHYGKLYPMNDLFGWKPIKDVKFEEFKDMFIITESFPIVGVKKTLKLIKTTDDKGNLVLKPWYPYFNADDKDLSRVISNSDITFIESTRNDLYESTKFDMSKAEIMQKIVLPMGMMILGIACLVFFPKIYAAIKADGNVAITTAISRFSETMSKFAPLG